MKTAIYAMVTTKGDLCAGQTKDGKNWEKKTVVMIPVGDERPIAVDFFGEERVKSVDAVNVGDRVLVKMDVWSREYEKRYYTQCDGYTIEKC